MYHDDLRRALLSAKWSFSSVQMQSLARLLAHRCAPQLQALQAWQQLQAAPGLNYVFSAARFSFPIQRALLTTATGVKPFDPQSIAKRSQDLTPAFHDAGQFYFGRTDAWLSQQAIFADNSKMQVLPHHLVQDIDTPEDWQRAELMFAAWHTGV